MSADLLLCLLQSIYYKTKENKMDNNITDELNQIKIKLAEKMHPQDGEFFVIRGYKG